jgi:UDP-glucose 4-epimerase
MNKIRAIVRSDRCDRQLAESRSTGHVFAVMHVLVTGGAGYIGSVVVEELIADGHAVTVIDNLSKGHRAAIAPDAAFVRADLHDCLRLRELFETAEIDAVVHLAADSLVGESVRDPGKYYRNNVVAGIGLLDAMVAAGVQRLVFSSTAAVYGEPRVQPIDESAIARPSNPYGETKLAFERALAWYESAYGLRSVSLRYFNAAGATERCGEDHHPETHLIPLVLQAALGQIPHVTLFGDDHSTPDGTCIRDYVHVRDLARAHVLALATPTRASTCYNLGCGGVGSSVREVVDVACTVTGATIPVKVGERRPGDPPVLIASTARIQQELDWRPRQGDLGEIIESAWRWMRDHPRGPRHSCAPARATPPSLPWPSNPTARRDRSGAPAMPKHVYALFNRAEDANAAFEEIRASGCENEYCSAILHENHIDRGQLTLAERGGKELAGKGAAVGVVGAVVGGLVALGSGLVGIGPLAAAAAAGGVTAAYAMLAGGISGSDEPERVLRAIEDELEKGRILVAVETEDEKLRVTSVQVFEKYGGYQIES